MKNKPRSHVLSTGTDAPRVDTGEPITSTTPTSLVDPDDPHERTTALMCATVARITGLSVESCLSLLLVLISAVLTGLDLVVGERRIQMSIGYWLPVVNSYSRSAAELIETHLAVGITRETVPLLFSGVGYAQLVELLDKSGGQIPLVSGSGAHIVHSQGSSQIALAHMDVYLGLLRGGGKGLSTYWRCSRSDYTSMVCGDSSGSLAAATLVLPLRVAKLVGLPQPMAPQPSIVQLISEIRRCRSEGVSSISFTADAVKQLATTCTGSADWSDDLRHLACLSAACWVLQGNGLGTGQVGLPAVENAINVWDSCCKESAELLSSGPPPGGITWLTELEQKATKLSDYASRKGLAVISPRDVVLSRIAATAAEARLILAIIEMQGGPVQELYLSHGRPFQRWIVNNQPCGSMKSGVSDPDASALPTLNTQHSSVVELARECGSDSTSALETPSEALNQRTITSRRRKRKSLSDLDGSPKKSPTATTESEQDAQKSSEDTGNEQ